MQIIFAQTDIKAIKTTIINIARDARNLPLPAEGRDIVRRIVADANAFGPEEVAKLQKAFDPQHLRIEVTAECGIAITFSTEALRAQLGLVEQYYEFAFDVVSMAMPVIRLAKKFAGRIKSSASAAAEMLAAKPKTASGSWETVDAAIRAGEAADLVRQHGEQHADYWSLEKIRLDAEASAHRAKGHAEYWTEQADDKLATEWTRTYQQARSAVEAAERAQAAVMAADRAQQQPASATFGGRPRGEQQTDWSAA